MRSVTEHPVYIKQKVAAKTKLRKIWQCSRSPEDKKRLNKACKGLEIFLTEYKNQRFHHLIENLDAAKDSNYSLWRFTSKLRQPKISFPPIKINSNIWARNDEAKVNAFTENYHNIFQPLPQSGRPYNEQYTTTTYIMYLQFQITHRYILHSQR